MADSEHERKVLTEVDQSRHFLGVARKSSSFSDDSVSWAVAIGLVLVVVMQIFVYSRTFWIVAGAMAVRLLWVILFDRGK